MAMNGNGFGDKEYVEEKVAYSLDPSQPNKYIPRISVSKTVDRIGRARVDKSFRPFEVDDIARVLDFDQVSDAPPDGPMMHCEIAGDGSMAFPNRHFCLRGGYLFYFDLSEVSGTGQSHYITYHGPPIGVVPLDKITIEFPPGGRRVFREHAHTDARSGYELVVLHNPDDDGETRPPSFLVAESLGQREKWAHALRARANIEGPTTLRAVAYTGDTFVTKPILSSQGGDETLGISVGMPASSASVAKKNDKGKSKPRSSRKSSMAGMKDDKGGDGDDAVIQEALHEFGKNNFVEKAWIDQYFETHTDVDAPARCRTMEQWQEAIKKGLKNAVLEQYEYFVEASGEMTTMGREVIALKNLVETQVETIKEMKEIDFGGSTNDNADDDGSAVDDVFEPGKIRKGRQRKTDFSDDQSDVSTVSSTGEFQERDRGDGVMVRIKYRDPSRNEGAIDIPEWFEDVTEEISAFVKECRYSDATELWSKVKQEVNDILRLHEQPTDNHLTRKQYQQLQSLRKSLDELAEMTSNRLVEGLRRKNEALKQAFKRERADPMSQMAPAVSPSCLGDDDIPLRLLVKLGKTQEAASAYSARRSLLLLESLHEKPISGTGSVDLVIYAAQLSQAFFSCLASSVEGFLDLFLTGNKEDHSADESSIQSLINIRSLPPGALASVVLWCDAELSKFGAAFGGTRILGNLALSPPPREAPVRRGPRVLGQSSEDANGNRDRTAAIEVASQCVGQAFQYASENLDAVGLPLTPRLAECIRTRLKGCEGEVAAMLDEQWRHITVDWEHNAIDEDIPMDERRGIPM